MTLNVRAIYENGQLRLLDPVELNDGQHVLVFIERSAEQNDQQPSTSGKRTPNLHEGEIWMSDDFDAPMRFCDDDD
jgi:predicted DNA-binding antitoxin AbrB/MazE fold protein